MTERWLPVVGFPNYEVSDLGRVRRFAPGDATHVGKILKPVSNGKGYLLAQPVRDGKNHRRYIHRLVAEAFLGPIPPGHEVNHKNCDKADNRLSNLEYVTRAGNMRHSHQSGRVPKGSQKSQAKLIEADVQAIRAMAAVGLEYSAAARLYGVSETCIRDVVTRRRWAHVA